MWMKEVDPGTVVEAEMGTGFLPYAAELIGPNRIGLTSVASELEPGQKPPMYPMPHEGQELTLRIGDRHSAAAVIEMSDGMIVVNVIWRAPR